MHSQPRLFQKIILEESLSLPNRRIINFMFNANGNSGKSLLSDYMELCPKFNGMLALQLASPERYNSALIHQFDFHKTRFHKYPSVIVFDFTRNEDSINVESVYSTLENIKNGRLDSSFYGKPKRIRFRPPHIFVFTNTVPNLSALSSDRFNLRVITDAKYNYIALRCSVDLIVEEANRGLVSWSYRAKLLGVKEQISFYEKTLSPSLMCEINEVLRNLVGQIDLEEFSGDIRTTALIKAPESVQREINSRFKKNYSLGSFDKDKGQKDLKDPYAYLKNFKSDDFKWDAFKNL